MKVAITSGILTSLSGRYAKALFDLAQSKGQIESVGYALNSIGKLIQSSKALKGALLNPTIRHEEHEAVINEICARLKAPEVLQSFIRLLVRAQRIPYMSKIEEIYQSLASRSKGEQRIEVVSAYPLTFSQSQLLKEKLTKVIPGALSLTFVIDPKVLGGIMVRIGGRVIDATLTTQLNQLSTAMKGSA